MRQDTVGNGTAPRGRASLMMVGAVIGATLLGAVLLLPALAGGKDSNRLGNTDASPTVVADGCVELALDRASGDVVARGCSGRQPQQNMALASKD